MAKATTRKRLTRNINSSRAREVVLAKSGSNVLAAVGFVETADILKLRPDEFAVRCVRLFIGDEAADSLQRRVARSRSGPYELPPAGRKALARMGYGWDSEGLVRPVAPVIGEDEDGS